MAPLAMPFFNFLSALASTLPAAYALVAPTAEIIDPSLFASKSYDYVVVGAGTAGLTVAARLAEDTRVTVGVIEAGQYLPNDPLIDIPKNFGRNTGQPKYDWMYSTTPQPALGNRSVTHPRGKVVGGSSALNFLLFNRASKPEYDAWNEFGNQGWGWDALLDGFKASSNYTPATDAQMFPGAGSAADANSQEKPFFGTAGGIDVTYNSFYSDLLRPFVQTLTSLGVLLNASPDTGNQTGLYNCPRSVDNVTGKRSYAGSTYYADHITQDNFSVLTGAQATKVNFGDSKEHGNLVAHSVTFVVNGTIYTVSAKREIILSAGAFQSPQLLELSGIGNMTLLKSLGISPLIDLPGVGENLQDHASLAQMFQVQPGVVTWDQLRINQTFAAAAAAQYNTTHDGPLSSTISALAFLPLQDIMSNDTQLPSMQYNLDKWLGSANPTAFHSKQYDIQKEWICKASVPMVELIMVPMGGLTQSPPANDTSYVTITAVNQHPFARGSVHINTTDPLAPPLINPNYLNNPFDTQVLVQSMGYINKIATSAPFANVIAQRIDPPTNFTTEAHFESHVRASLQNLRHPVGTCAMAERDLHGVVDSSLKVYGTTNLRVVDASIIPIQLAAHTQSTTYAIGEKAAVIIKNSSTLPSSGYNLARAT